MAVRINSTPLVIGKPLHQRFGSTSDTAGPISLGANPSLHFTYFFRIQRVRLSCSQHADILLLFRRDGPGEAHWPDRYRTAHIRTHQPVR